MEWICIAGQIVFLPFVFVTAGRSSPRKAHEDERAHEEKVQRELAAPGRSTLRPCQLPPARRSISFQ